MEGDQPGILPDVYPSDNIDAMLKAGETMEGKLYLQRYAIYTEFKELGHITVLVEYCKQTIPELLRKKNFDEEGPRLKEIAAQTDATEKHVFWFHREIVKRLLAKQYAFIAYTATDQFNFYDLAEDVTKIRLITTGECGTCKRIHTAELPLDECKFCHCAAYCNNKCRKKDLRFHQKHCKSLRQDYERRKGRLEVLKHQQVARQMTTDDILNAGIEQKPAQQQQPQQEERVEDMDEEVVPEECVTPVHQDKAVHDPDYARQLVERLKTETDKEDEPDVSSILLGMIEQACSTGEFERLATTSRLQNLKTHWIAVNETMVQRGGCDYLLVLSDAELPPSGSFTLDKECGLLAQCACSGDHHFGVYACE